MKFALVASALVFATTTLAGGPTGYGDQNSSPQENQGSGRPNPNGKGIASPVGQGGNGRPASYGEQNVKSPQGNQGPGSPDQSGHGIASPVGQGGHGRPPSYGEQNTKSPQENQGPGSPDQSGHGIASPVGQGKNNGAPGHRQASPQGNQRDRKPNEGGHGIASPVEQGNNGHQPGGNGGGSPGAYGQAQNAPVSGDQGNGKPNYGPGKLKNGGSMVSPVSNGNGKHDTSGPQCCIESPIGGHGPPKFGQGARDSHSQQQRSPQQQRPGQPAEGHNTYQDGNGKIGQCITPQEGQEWLDQFISVLGHTGQNIEQTANEIIADQFIEISNSILSLQAKPLSSESVAAPSKQAWVQGVTNAPAPQGIQTKDIIVGCDKLVWYWTFDKVGAGRYPQNGFNLFHFVRNGGRLQADRLDIEFDSIAWGLNTGRLQEVEYSDGTEVKGAQEEASGGASGAEARD